MDKKKKKKAVVDAMKIKRGDRDGNGDFGKPDSLIVRSQSSVTLDRDSKGGVKFSIKIYNDDAASAAAEAIAVERKLSKMYPPEKPPKKKKKE